MVHWKVKGVKGHPEETVARDVGHGGLKFTSKDALPLGTHLALILDLTGDRLINAEADVVWAREIAQIGGASYEIGVKLTQIAPDDQERLATYCDRLPVSQRRT